MVCIFCVSCYSEQCIDYLFRLFANRLGLLVTVVIVSMNVVGVGAASCRDAVMFFSGFVCAIGTLYAYAQKVLPELTTIAVLLLGANLGVHYAIPATVQRYMLVSAIAWGSYTVAKSYFFSNQMLLN